MKRGLFLSFEGGEGSGKSLQARRLAEALTARGRDVVLTREPGGTAAGERIRDIVLHAREIPLSPEAQVMLFSSARAQLVHEVIRPALEAGKIVVADRFFDSTVVYQGYGHGVALDAIRQVTALAVGTLVPDRTFLLDVPVDVGLARSGWHAESRWDRFEVDTNDFHVRVRDAYLRLAAAEPRRFVVIAGDRDEAEVAADIRRQVDAMLGAPA
ncbi:MAG TPA: dTMP kinase [Candidatus Limnocylindria bacterium]|nr:dTMP kinase [Candidatus Limnocylindria bacterium]